jgi:hypothetical protein
MSDTPARITPAAKALLNAERVRDKLTFCGVRPMTPELTEEQGKIVAPHLVELCRLLVEQWYRLSPTPQPMSTTIINIRDCIIFAAREERGA